MLPNASYFAFTTTPKNKTLEIFGEPYPEGDKVKHRLFHSYTMKQAIQEGFILDVLRYYSRSTAITGWSRPLRPIPSLTPSPRRRSCGGTSRAMTTPSGSRPRSWSIIFTYRCWR